VRTVRAQVEARSRRAGPDARHAGEDPRAAHDLAIARRVQAQLLPQTAPPLATPDYAGLCREAGAVGGDFHDFLPMGPGRVGLVLADVSGKGVSAALLMANLQASLRAQSALYPGEAAQVLRSVNRLFFASTAPEHYATAFFAAYDDRTRRLRYANCGHLPPVVLRRGARRGFPRPGPGWACSRNGTEPKARSRSRRATGWSRSPTASPRRPGATARSSARRGSSSSSAHSRRSRRPSSPPSSSPKSSRSAEATTTTT
jgi:Stage II sporulation protein E (SpoIIE)